MSFIHFIHYTVYNTRTVVCIEYSLIVLSLFKQYGVEGFFNFYSTVKSQL